MWATFRGTMTNGSQLSRVIVVPRNGYVNRLQTWASAAILADNWNAPLDVLWETEDVAPTALSDLVDVTQLQPGVVTSSEVTEVLGSAHQQMPRYLSIDSHRGFAFLAGHDRGEQVFMDALSAAVLLDSSINTVVIVAGGKFQLPDQVDFNSRRRACYQDLPWQPSIRTQVDHFVEQVPAYVGLHIRETDRSTDAPSRRMIDRSLRRISDATQIQDVFIAADTATARDRWSKRVSDLGMTPWSESDAVLDRTDPRAGHAAIADWLTLGNARGLVFSSASSFGQEAAVMCGDPELTYALRAGSTHRLLRSARRISGNGLRRLGIR